MESSFSLMESCRPSILQSTLDDLLATEYRLKIVEINELNSHEDKNFHIVCKRLESMEANAQWCNSSVQNSVKNGLAISTNPRGNYDDVYGCLGEKLCHQNLGGAAVQLRNEDQVMSNGTGERQLENDKCFHSSFSNSETPNSSEADSTQFEFLLKIMIDKSLSAVDLEDCRSISKTNQVELQMKVASHLRSCGFVCPEVVTSVSTGSLVQELLMHTKGETVRYLVYLTKYITGSTLNDMVPLSSDMMFEVGNLLAQVHQSLKGISISCDNLLSTSPWSLENANKIKDFFSEAELDTAEQELVSNVLDCFLQNVLPHLKKLPHGVIHGDFHDENILLLKKNQLKNSNVQNDICEHDHNILSQTEYIRAKYAVIDFGDVSYSPYMFDLAIATSYFMMCDPGPDFIQNVAHFLHGYFTSYKPTVLEFKSLFASVCAAYCRETVLSKYSYIEQRGSNKYLLTAIDAGWRQLKELWSVGQEDVISVWSETWEKYGLRLGF